MDKHLVRQLAAAEVISDGEMIMPAAQEVGPILVKRYVRGRLYDTGSGRYVSVGQLQAWAAENVAFVVVDSQTGVDVTGVLLPAGLNIC